MEKRGDSRQKAIEAAERLFRTQGYAATGLTEILEVSGAPKGSFYFHFPGGKRELARAVLDAYGARIEAGIRALAARHDGDLAGFVRALCKAAAKDMEATDWTFGCAAQNLANELAPGDGEFAAALAEIFAGWIAAIAEGIKARHPSRAAAERRATAILAALEGARTLARSARSGAAFDAVIDLVLTGQRA